MYKKGHTTDINAITTAKISLAPKTLDTFMFVDDTELIKLSPTKDNQLSMVGKYLQEEFKS